MNPVRTLLLAIALSLSALLLYGLAQPYMWSTFPSMCPLARYLPPDGRATRCESSGLIDFEIVFEARVSLAGFETFKKGLLADVKNPKAIESNGYYFRYEADEDVLIEFDMQKGIMSVDYFKY